MDFALIMLIALVVTGVIWLADIYLLKPKRASGAKDPVLVEYAKSFFPVILIVFLLRSFLVEPFKIPSGSMIPSLNIGDYILVNKFTYGIRLPVVNIKLFDVHHPARGDVMVFRYPVDPSLDYIKRVVGLPGDRVDYHNKRLTINGVPVKMVPEGNYNYTKSGLNFVSTKVYKEQLGSHINNILVQPDEPSVRPGQYLFKYRENCEYNDDGFTCVVPKGHYFMMGDNRDDSTDSRYWGFVPDRNIVGRAFMIWWNFDDFKRIGHFID